MMHGQTKIKFTLSGVSTALLLTINFHFSFFLIKYLSKKFLNWRNTHFAYVQHQRPTMKRLLFPLLLRSNGMPLYVQSGSIGRNSNLEKKNMGRINSLENQISLTALI